MRSLVFVASILTVAFALPQRNNNCQCRDIICPSVERDACECRNRAANECFRNMRNPTCPSPVPENCNIYGGSNAGYGGQPVNQQPPPGWRSTQYQTVTSVLPRTTTITTTLSGFAYPNPVTSFSYRVTTTTITYLRPPSGITTVPTQRPTTRYTTTITQSRPTQQSQFPPWQQTSQWNPPWGQPTQQPPPPPPASQYTPPWMIPPPPPSSGPPFTTQPPFSQPPPSNTRPPPWTPPTNTGPQWTPVNNPDLPNTLPPSPNPGSLAPPSTSAGPPQPSATLPSMESQIKCGPGLPACTGDTYCDPQPLCSIGEDCPGICLPTVNLGYADQPNSQPLAVRRAVWQGLLDNGEFVLYRHVP